MPRAKKPLLPPDPLKPPSRAVCDTIIRRFLKTTINIDWAFNMSTFYKLWKQYPSLDFWEKHELPFGGGSHALNMMNWFNSVEGKAHLQSTWTLFHYNPEQPKLDIVQESTDTVKVDDSQSVSNLPPPPVYPDRPRTVADMLRDI